MYGRISLSELWMRNVALIQWGRFVLDLPQGSLNA